MTKERLKKIAESSKLAIGKKIVEETADLDVEEPSSKKSKMTTSTSEGISKEPVIKGGNSFGRFNTQKTVPSGKEDDAEMKPIKKSVVIWGTPLKAFGLTKVESDALQDQLSGMESYTPIKEITQYSETGTPQKAISESGEKLNKLSSTGMMVVFVNRATKEQDEKFEIDPNFKDSAIAKKIKPPETSQKLISIMVTPESLELVAEQIKENQGHRSISQNKVMGGGATEYSRTAGISLNNRSEWAHLVAHRFLSDLAQIYENLVASTAFANTEMMPVEDFVSAFVKNKLGEVKLEVTAYTIDNTQIAISINYDVIINGNKLPFKFDAQQLEKPDIANKHSLEILFSVLKKKMEETKDETFSSSTSTSEEFHLSKVFFSRSSNIKPKEKETTASTAKDAKDDEAPALTSKKDEALTSTAYEKLSPLSIKYVVEETPSVETTETSVKKLLF